VRCLYISNRRNTRPAIAETRFEVFSFFAILLNLHVFAVIVPEREQFFVNLFGFVLRRAIILPAAKLLACLIWTCSAFLAAFAIFLPASVATIIAIAKRVTVVDV
jgi:hypothetical protein